MSLKAFHVFFLLTAIVLSLGTGGWAFAQFADHQERPYLVMGAVCLALGLGLAVYFRWFLKKLRHVSYL